MPKFILVRHGESVWNGERRIQLDGRSRRVLLFNDTCHPSGGGSIAPRDVLADAGATADPAF
jgi:hypothetical protein